MSHVIPIGQAVDPAQSKPGKKQVFFHREEFQTILNVYSRAVAAGEWKDYSLQMGENWCAWAIYRRAAEAPVFRIEKRPKKKGGPYWIYDAQGHVLKHGQDLKSILRVIEPKKVKVVS